jgi:hypothetical protein
MKDPDAPRQKSVFLMVPKRPDWTTLVAQVDDCTLYPGQVRGCVRRWLSFLGVHLG